MANLKPSELKFVQYYEGNATEALRKAGHKGTDGALAVTATRMLKKAKIQDALERRIQRKDTSNIASREQRQSFWTEVMNDSKGEMRDRLKASELLGKSQADFTENVKHSGSVSLTEAIKKNRKARGLTV